MTDERFTKSDLRIAWNDFQGAGLGRLNITADRLREVAKGLGWRPIGGPTILIWCRDYLGIPQPKPEADDG